MCVSVTQQLTSRMSNRAIKKTYILSGDHQKYYEDFSEMTAFKSYGVKHKHKSQYANYSGLQKCEKHFLSYYTHFTSQHIQFLHTGYFSHIFYPDIIKSEINHFLIVPAKNILSLASMSTRGPLE